MARIVFIGDVFCENAQALAAWPRDLCAECCVLNFEYVFDNGKLTGADAAEQKTNLKGTGSPFLSGMERYVATLANNHVLDYTKKGCESTLAFLKANSVTHAGMSGPGIGEQYVQVADGVTLSAYMSHKLKYASVSGCPYAVNELNVDRVIDDARKARIGGSRFHVVSLHWGTELLSKPWPNQVEQAHALIDSGVVDLIVGMHPHCIQPIERYKHKLVFYSIGNGVFPNFSQESKFQNGCPGIVYGCSWGRESMLSIVPVIDTDTLAVTWSTYKYVSSSMIQSKVEIAAIDHAPRICAHDANLAVWRRVATGFRLLARGEMGTAWFNLKSAALSRKSYFRTLDAVAKNGKGVDRI